MNKREQQRNYTFCIRTIL